jgi:hypothetical protein
MNETKKDYSRQGGSRPKIPHLRLIFVKKVDLTPPLPPFLPYLDRRCPYMVISHDVQHRTVALNLIKQGLNNNIMLKMNVVLTVLDFLPFIQVEGSFSQVYTT